VGTSLKLRRHGVAVGGATLGVALSELVGDVVDVLVAVAGACGVLLATLLGVDGTASVAEGLLVTDAWLVAEPTAEAVTLGDWVALAACVLVAATLLVAFGVGVSSVQL